MRKTLLVVIAGLLAVGAGLYVVVVRPVMAPSEEAPIAERALVKPDVVLLAEVNVKQAVFLEKWFLGSPVFDSADGRPLPAAQERTLLGHLRAANVDPRRDIDQLFYALYPADDAGLRQAIVLLGRFDPAAVGDYLARELHGIRRAVSGRDVYEITTRDLTTCAPSSTWMVTVDPKWILVADAGSHAALLPRLTGVPDDAGPALGWWRPLARADVLGLAVWDPSQLGSATTQPILKASADAVAAATNGFRRVYLGLGVKPVPPQGRLRFVIDAQDATRVSQQLAAFRHALDESRARWAETMPTVAALYASLQARSEGGQTTIEFTVDRTLAANLQQLVSELVAAAFGGLGLHRATPDSGPPAEQLDPHPAVFQQSLAASTLPAYDPKAQFAEDVDQAEGPFGLRIESIRLGSTPEVGLELAVGAFSGPIPNVVGEDTRVRLFVESVKSTAGRELLRAEDCGKERNALPAPFDSIAFGRLKAEKTVRLVPGADPKALQSVSGRVVLRLPTRTEVVSVPRGERSTVIRRYGATFMASKVEGGSVSFQTGGDTDRVLLFRAVNGRGQPLASHGGYSGHFLFGEGISGEKDYAGAVDRVEVVFAAETQTLEFPFTLTKTSLAGKPGNTFPDRTPPFRPYGYEAIRADESLTGRRGPGPDGWKRLSPPAKPESHRSLALLEPFELYFDQAQAFYALKLDFTLRSPDVPNFEKAFSVGQLRLTRIELKDGTAVEPPTSADPAAPPSMFQSKWDTTVRFSGAPKDGALATPLYLLINTKAKPEELKTLKGILTVQFPKTLETLRLDDLTVGRKAQLGDMNVTVVKQGRKSLMLETSRDGDRVVYIRLLSADGQAVAFFGPETAALPGGAQTFELSPLGAYNTAEVIVARDRDTKSYAFVLTAG